MDVILGNPSGLWGLLGIPAVLLIHFLQRRAVVIPVSTLFLLPPLQRESQGGRKWEQLLPSVPLFLQLVSVLILTWLLADPRWLETTSVQRIAVVLDGSASMTVPRNDLLIRLPDDLNRLASATQHAEIHLLDSRPQTSALYHGPAGAPLRKAMENWIPAGGTVDPGPALALARNLAGREGLVLYVTDGIDGEMPPGVRRYTAGKPMENCGIAGISVGEKEGRWEWRAVLRNYSQTAQARAWKVMAGPTILLEETLTLPPGQLVLREGPFPPDAGEIRLALSPDGFPMDDQAPALRPKLKVVRYALPPHSGLGPPVLAPLLASLPGMEVSTGPVDVQVIEYNPLAPELPEGPAVIFVRDPQTDTPLLSGTVLVEPHPLTEALGWQSLISQDGFSIPFRTNDQPLVWIGERAVVFLRSSGDHRQLCFNFDLRKSNARRLPSLVLTLHRWMEQHRKTLPGEEWTNSECGQPLEIAVRPAPAPETITLLDENGSTNSRPVREAGLLRAPATPGVLEVRQGDQLLLRTASHFADVREADFSDKSTDYGLEGVASAITLRHSRADSAWRIWILILLALAGISWWWLSSRGRAQQVRESRWNTGS